MNLLDIVMRDPEPQPWAEVSKIPWDDPDFSRRMLLEHISQEHDAASRRAAIIDQQVRWLHIRLLNAQPSKILDLGCGPGLYCSRLAQLGHACAGIDFGPASIDYARQSAADLALDCEFILGDLRTSGFGEQCDLIMLLFGELNVFRREDTLAFLRRAGQALSSPGKVVLEVHTLEAVRARGERDPSWSAAEHGLFSDEPYLRLNDVVWLPEALATVERHYVIDAASADVTLYGTTTQGYTHEGYEDLLQEAGFTSIDWHDDWPVGESNGEFELIVAGR